MKKRQRMSTIRQRLRAEPREWRVDELAEIYNVSPLTIRRDLDEMERQNLILRTHGGCIAGGQVADSPYYRKISENYKLKSLIGCRAAQLVEPEETILLNDGSTCFHLAANLGGCAPLTVYTNSISMISELSRFEGIRVFVLGGEYNRELFYLVGGLMESILEVLKFDIVFLGADAVDPDGSCLTCNADVARVTEIMLRRGERLVLLADHTKLNAGGHMAYGTLEDFDMWITTPGLPDADREKLGSMTDLVECEHDKMINYI